MRAGLLRCRALSTTGSTIAGQSAAPSLLPPHVISTECYQESTVAPPLRINLFQPDQPLKNNRIGVRDLVLCRGLFEKDDISCSSILGELREFLPSSDWIPLHKGKHYGTRYEANDFKDIDDWGPSCPQLALVMKRLESTFNMRVSASRLNVYDGAAQWKPFHHDAHAFADSPRGPTRSADRNFTVMASFGSPRQYALQETAEPRHPSGFLSVDLQDGDVVGLSRDANILYRHGLLPGRRPHDTSSPRISIVLNGIVGQIEESDNLLS